MTDLVDYTVNGQKSAAPSRKVSGSTVGAAIGAIAAQAIIARWPEFFAVGDLTTMLEVVTTGVASGVVALVTGYFTRERKA